MPTCSEVIMTHKDMRSTLIRHFTELEEGPALALTQHLLDEGIDPVILIKDCEEAMFAVGERYASQQYYLPGLIIGR